jgi:hypothetical protein
MLDTHRAGKSAIVPVGSGRRYSNPDVSGHSHALQDAIMDGIDDYKKIKGVDDVVITARSRPQGVSWADERLSRFAGFKPEAGKATNPGGTLLVNGQNVGIRIVNGKVVVSDLDLAHVTIDGRPISDTKLFEKDGLAQLISENYLANLGLDPKKGKAFWVVQHGTHTNGMLKGIPETFHPRFFDEQVFSYGTSGYMGGGRGSGTMQQTFITQTLDYFKKNARPDLIPDFSYRPVNSPSAIIVYENGVGIPKDRSVLEAGFQRAGFESYPSTRTSEAGTNYVDPESGVIYRIMYGYGEYNKPRLITHHPNGGNVIMPNGQNIPSSVHGKQAVREVTHFMFDEK